MNEAYFVPEKNIKDLACLELEDVQSNSNTIERVVDREIQAQLIRKEPNYKQFDPRERFFVQRFLENEIFNVAQLLERT